MFALWWLIQCMNLDCPVMEFDEFLIHIVWIYLFKCVKFYKFMQPWTWQSLPPFSRSHPLVFACLGFLSPANRGALMTCAVVLWVLLGTPAGYVAARYYKCKYTAEVWPLTSDPPFIRAVCSSLDLISVKGALYPNRQAYTPLLLFCFSCVRRLVQITMRAYSSLSYYDISCRSICWALSVLTSVMQQMLIVPFDLLSIFHRLISC